MLAAKYSSIAIFICFVAREVKSDPITVDFKYGKIMGLEQTSIAGEPFFSFLKIPYAKPPIGELRFKEAQRPEKWSGVRDGREMGPVCAQFNYFDMLTDYRSPFKGAGEEDCLYLNVFTKQISPKRALPVMVYIHGGGYVAGGASNFLALPLMDGDIIVVVIQYRLGLLGFLWTEDSIFPSNLGLKDQTMALRWVNENIENFGGDPNRVTIVGQSAGGASVHAHILSDYSKDLFSRAIMMSGTLLCPFAKMIKPRLTAMKIGDQFGCFESDPKAEGKAKSKLLMECLKKADLEDILKATRYLHEWSYLPKRSVPYVDGDFLPDSIETMVRNSKMKAIDVIFGVTADEGSYVSSAILKMEDQRRDIKDKFSNIGPISLGLDREEGAVELSKKAYDLYVGGVKNEIKDYFNITNMFGDRHFKVCSDNAALFQSRHNAKEGKKTYFYEFGFRSKYSLLQRFQNPPLTDKLVTHSDDVYYLMGRTFDGTRPKNNPNEAKVMELFTQLFRNFVHTGDPTPNSSLGFKWEPFSEESPSHLRITPEPHMEGDLRKEKRDFWNSLPILSNQLLYEENYGAKEEL